MGSLMQRIKGFQNTFFEQHKTLYQKLKVGQDPKILFITCSDSRVIPSIILQAKPGDVFTVQTAGNLIPPHIKNSGESATIEYALTALDIEDIIVCGHSHCGAMAAVINPEATKNMPVVREWLSDYAVSKNAVVDKNPDCDNLHRAAIDANALLQLERLKQYPLVQQKLEQSHIKLHGWVYEFESGNIFSYNENTQAFEPFAENNLAVNTPESLSFTFALKCCAGLFLGAGASLSVISFITLGAVMPLISASLLLAGAGCIFAQHYVAGRQCEQALADRPNLS